MYITIGGLDYEFVVDKSLIVPPSGHYAPGINNVKRARFCQTAPLCKSCGMDLQETNILYPGTSNWNTMYCDMNNSGCSADYQVFYKEHETTPTPPDTKRRYASWRDTFPSREQFKKYYGFDPEEE